MIAEHLRSIYSAGGEQKFDCQFLGEQVYEKNFLGRCLRMRMKSRPPARPGNRSAAIWTATASALTWAPPTARSARWWMACHLQRRSGLGAAQEYRSGISLPRNHGRHEDRRRQNAARGCDRRQFGRHLHRQPPHGGFAVPRHSRRNDSTRSRTCSCASGRKWACRWK